MARKSKAAPAAKRPAASAFETYKKGLSKEDAALLQGGWADFDTHCQLVRREKRQLQGDFEAAILYYTQTGLSLSQALERLDVRQLGGFYARPPVLWFALDDAAKVYPLSMRRGYMSVFRLSVYLRQPVVPPLLQMALNFTIKRFPTFATTLKKGFFWHYLDTTKRRFDVKPEQDVPCQPLPVWQSGSQSFRVLYFQNRISVEFFHVLTDGTGGLVFLKALTAAYLRLLGVEITPEEAWDTEAPPQAAEFENAFERLSLQEVSSPQEPPVQQELPPQQGTPSQQEAPMRQAPPRPQETPPRAAAGFADRPAVQLSGRLAGTRPCRILHFKMDAAALQAAAKRYGATVTSYLLALLFLAGRAATDELQGEASIQVPVNMRKFYPSRTVRNFALYCGVRLPLQTDADLPALVRAIDAQLRQKVSAQAMTQMLATTRRTVHALRYVPLGLKQPVARLVYGFLGDGIFTNTLSNLGVVRLPPAMAAQVESMDFVLGTLLTNRVGCAAVTCGQVATLSITKLTVDPTFEEALYALLERDGLTVTVQGSENYEG